MIRCKLVEVVQGSDVWHDCRKGRITASRMGDVLAGKSTKRYTEYRRNLVMGLLGYEPDQEEARWAAHGRAFEPFARTQYAEDRNVEVIADVFCISSKYDWLGCSPDGLVLPDYETAIEIKGREKLTTWIEKVERRRRLGKIDSSYRPQVQAQMWVMGLPSIEYIEYWRDMETRAHQIDVFTVQRDSAAIDEMEGRCLELMHEAYELANKDTGELAA